MKRLDEALAAYDKAIALDLASPRFTPIAARSFANWGAATRRWRHMTKP